MHVSFALKYKVFECSALLAYDSNNEFFISIHPNTWFFFFFLFFFSFAFRCFYLFFKFSAFHEFFNYIYNLISILSFSREHCFVVAPSYPYIGNKGRMSEVVWGKGWFWINIRAYIHKHWDAYWYRVLLFYTSQSYTTLITHS